MSDTQILHTLRWAPRLAPPSVSPKGQSVTTNTNQVSLTRRVWTRKYSLTVTLLVFLANVTFTHILTAPFPERLCLLGEGLVDQAWHDVTEGGFSPFPRRRSLCQRQVLRQARATLLYRKARHQSHLQGMSISRSLIYFRRKRHEENIKD